MALTYMPSKLPAVGLLLQLNYIELLGGLVGFTREALAEKFCVADHEVSVFRRLVG